MKKMLRLACLLLLPAGIFAKPVSMGTAATAATSFYRQTTHNEVNNSVLVYTSYDENGKALYFAFNVNFGFVIVSGDDATFPVIGYSTERGFEVPESRSTIGNWLKFRGEEIAFARKGHLEPTAKIMEKWNALIASNAAEKQFLSTASVVTPIISTTWNQSPFYNAMCPGGSVTGCVATAMAQIMKYWNYPATGNGTSSYNSNYGMLSCDYGSTTYNWANMPNHITSANNDVALINYHCGVSVEMDYSPSGSGAWVCSFDNAVCAENSYKNYFRYDANIIHGEGRWNYDDTTWMSMLKADLDLGRPIQYVGWDPNAGGHTWVCDGYDQNDFLHMNWGWGGSGNGYYFLDNMAPSGYNFSDGHEAVLGIVPMASVATDAMPQIQNPIGYYCSGNFSPVVKLQNLGSSNMTSCLLYYSVDNAPAQSVTWSGSLVTGQFDNVSLPAFTVAPGSHTLVVYSSNPNSTADDNTGNDQMTVTFHVTVPGTTPIVEGFESGISTAEWSQATTGGGNSFVATTAASASGSSSAMIDNLTNVAGSTCTLETNKNFDLTGIPYPQLVFKVAYQMKNSASNDKMQLFVSNSCSYGWTSKWVRSGTGLATVSSTGTAPFVPSSSDFMTYTVNLYGFASSQNVSFRWIFFADPTNPGNNVYLDDINIISALTGVNTVSAANKLEVYPNPSDGNFTIALNLDAPQAVSYTISDMLGQTIVSAPEQQFAAGAVEFAPLSKVSCAPGVYFVNVRCGAELVSKKIVIE